MIIPLDAKKPLTTGQVARLCHVSMRTASKWCDTGLIGHWKIPNSNDRRIMPLVLVEFMRKHGIPVPPELPLPEPPMTIAFGLYEVDLRQLPGCRVAESAVALGGLLREGPIGLAVLGDGEGRLTMLSAAKMIRALHPTARIVAIISESSEEIVCESCDLIVRRPVNWATVVANP